MDLNVSPDLDAIYCYLVVLLLGAVAAIRQISGRLVRGVRIWFFPRTWLLFLAYLLVPLLLFWLLDRTGAITDTSLFAAILVGIGYERIITGGSETIRAPGDVSSFWSPFVAYTDRVAAVIRDQLARSQARLAERVVATIAADQDRYKEMESLALSRSPDVKALQDQLAAITGGETEKVLAKSRLLYAVMMTVPDAHYLMKGKGIIGPWIYWAQLIGGVVPLGRAAIVIGVLTASIVAAAWLMLPDNREEQVAYYVWRLGKTNSTAMDQYRSRRNLLALLGDTTASPEMRRRRVEQATEKLADMLRRPGLPMERVDLTLQILLESRSLPGGNPALPPRLSQSLRAASVDARSRVNEVLKHLAGSCLQTIEDRLQSWKPSDGDSTAILEVRIELWQQYWSHGCNIKA